MFTKFVLYVWWYILKCPILVTQSLYILHFSTHTLRWSKQPEPYVKAYKFLCKSDRYTSAKIFILDISGKPYLSGLAISRLLILLFQHQHINIHIRALEILCVQLIFPIISPQIKNSIIYPLYSAHDTRFVSACGGPFDVYLNRSHYLAGVLWGVTGPGPYWPIHKEQRHAGPITRARSARPDQIGHFSN